uniref:Transcription factor IIIC subunit 5 HTH domain-containing protein n=1 Tax=Plectus sambesii TaxID=2011161 RepID=A0A914XKF6_9BILA
MNELFEERPVWTRQAISCKTGLEDQVIKILMPKYAFYIQSGPWGRLWCRFGYDPRKDPTARQYQTVMVSFRRHRKIPERPRLKMTDKWTIRTSGSRQKAELTDSEAANAYMYTPGQLPSVRQMWYSLCDVGLQIAADYLALVFEPPGNVADAQHGWLPSEALDAIRNEIKNDVKRTSNLIDAVEADEMGEEEDDVDDWLD